MCPICRRAALVRHCPESNTTCTWRRCRGCGVTMDAAARRGFDKANKPVVWPKAA